MSEQYGSEKIMKSLKSRFRLLHTMIRVLDLDKSIDFYTRHLGMRLLRRTDFEIGRFTLAFVGYGDEAELIPKNIKRLDLGERVTFLGKSPAAHRLMPLIDVIASPTQFFDAFPTVILEAMEANCCIIGSDIDAHKAQLKHDALMFPSGDAAALACCLKNLYSDEKVRGLNSSLIKERRQNFEFDWDAQVVEILTRETGV